MTPVPQKTDPLRFFASTLDDTFTDKFLELPKFFVKKYLEKYGKELPNIVGLKPSCDSCDKEWEVEVTRHNGVVWLEKGWEDFCKFYSFQSKYLLVFQYEGNSTFKVNIFDETQTEIDYPVKTPMRDNDVDDHIASTPMPQKKQPAGSSGEKVERGKSTQRSKEQTTEVLGRKQSSTTTRKAKAPASAKKLIPENCFYIKMHPTYVEGDRLWLPSEFARYMKSLVPNGRELKLCVLGGRRKHWTVSVRYREQKDMAKSRVTLYSGWSKFVRDNKLHVDDECFFTLIDKHEVLFEVKIVRGIKAASEHSSSQDNANAGDDKDDEVSENDSDDDAEDSCDEGQEHTEDSFVNKRKRSSSTTTTKASLSATKLIMSPSYVKGYHIFLNRNFVKAMKSFIQNGDELRLRVLGGSRKAWTVSVKYREENNRTKQVSLCSGWREFVRENKLHAADELFFTLINKRQLLFEVRIVRDKESSKHNSTLDNPNAGNDKDDEVSENDRDDVTEDNSDEDSLVNKRRRSNLNTKNIDSLVNKRKRSNLNTKNIDDVGHGSSRTQHSKRTLDVPRSIYMGPISARGRPYFEVDRNLHAPSLELPIEFANQYLHGKTSHVKLHNQNSDRKPWSVGLYFGNKQAYFKDGWIEFVHGNFLQENAMCVFELTDEREFEFDVHFLPI